MTALRACWLATGALTRRPTSCARSWGHLGLPTDPPAALRARPLPPLPDLFPDNPAWRAASVRRQPCL